MFTNMFLTGFDLNRFSTSLGINSPKWVGGFVILIGCVIIAQAAWAFHKAMSGQGGAGKYWGLGFAGVIVGGMLAIKGSVETLRGFGNGTANSIKEMGQGTAMNVLPTLTSLPFHSLIHLL